MLEQVEIKPRQEDKETDLLHLYKWPGDLRSDMAPGELWVTEQQAGAPLVRKGFIRQINAIRDSDEIHEEMEEEEDVRTRIEICGPKNSPHALMERLEEMVRKLDSVLPGLVARPEGVTVRTGDAVPVCPATERLHLESSHPG